MKLSDFQNVNSIYKFKLNESTIELTILSIDPYYDDTCFRL